MESVCACVESVCACVRAHAGMERECGCAWHALQVWRVCVHVCVHMRVWRESVGVHALPVWRGVCVSMES